MGYLDDGLRGSGSPLGLQTLGSGRSWALENWAPALTCAGFSTAAHWIDLRYQPPPSRALLLTRRAP